MINRFSRRTPYDLGLYTPPIEVAALAMEKAQNQYNQNFQLAHEIKNKYVESLPQDRAKANEIQLRWEKQVDEIVANYQGDYSKASKDLALLISDMRKQYNPGGEAHAITSNYMQYNDWLTRHRDRVEKGKVMGDDLNLANSYIMKNYTGIGTVDPVTGAFNKVNTEDLVDHIDEDKIIRDVYSTFKPEKRSQGMSYLDKDGFIKYEKVETDGITKDRLLPSFRQALAGNDQFVSYQSQKAKFLGIDPNQYLPAYVDNYSNRRAQDLSYLNMSSDSKMERDPLYVARAKASMDKENMMSMLSTLQYETGQPNVTMAKEPTIDPDNWRDDTSFADYIVPGSTGLFGNVTTRDYSERNRRLTEPKQSLDSFLSSDKSTAKLLDKNVNPNLAKALWEKKKQDFSADYSTKYGKDMKWTQQFEKNFWWDYKKEHPNHTAYQTYSQTIDGPAKNSTLKQILPEVLSGNAMIYTPGNATERHSRELDEEIIKALYDDEKGLKNLDALGLKYVQPGPGYIAAGYQIDTPKGSFVISDQDVQRRQWSNMMSSALAPIYFHGKSKGAKGVAGVDPKTGQFMMGTPEIRYEWNESLGKMDENLYWEIDPGKYVKKNIGQIQEETLPLFHGALGYGQSKADAQPFMYFLQSVI